MGDSRYSPRGSNEPLELGHIYIIFKIFLFDSPKINFEPPRPKFFLSLAEMSLNMIILTISWSF